jgi:arginyl-tRNA synthetase
VRQNHVGDWGTQFGMLLQYLDETGANSAELDDLEAFYRDARARFDTDPPFADRCRAKVVRLQGNDPATLAQWRHFIAISLSHCEDVYRRLGVTLTRADVMAESAYNDDLDQVLADLDSRGLLTLSDGAMCVFLDQFTGKDDAPLPLIVRKSDGGYLYSTTDLAAIRHRAGTLAADRALYFTDGRQALHFQQVFAVARAAGFAPATLSLEHMPFGTMLGTDGRPFRTREGAVVKLNDLLDEAEERAFALVSAKNPSLGEAERRRVAHAVGIGAIKYADLSKNRTSDYLFDWNQMLAFEGNTAPYLQYAYARIVSLFRRGGIDPDTVANRARPTVAAERDLAVGLVRLQEIAEQVAADGMPHVLCGYLYDLSVRFTRFYERCPVLGSGADEPNRLAFAKRTAESLRLGLGLLGIETVERM